MISLSAIAAKLDHGPAPTTRAPNGVVVGQTIVPAPKAKLEMGGPSVPYSDRSNCRRALKKFAEKIGLPTDAFETFGQEGEFRFRLKEPADDGFGIPGFLMRPKGPQANPVVASANPERQIKNPPDIKKDQAPMRPASSEPVPEDVMRYATNKSKSKSNARSAASADERKRYDWAGAEDAAKRGKIPNPPDFSAETHKRFRPMLSEVVKAAKAGDAKALKAVDINPVSTSPKAVARYRDICLAALKAKVA